jgi:transcriptional regulator with XRE-family HTH domain/ribosome-associated toxin RatA of RatAB toxin-antitoxin module
MPKMPKKYELIEKLLATLRENVTDIKAYEQLEKNCESQLKIEKDDQLRDALRITRLQILKKSFGNRNNFKERIEITMPTINRLRNLEAQKWDLYDIRILQCCVAYCETFQKCHKLVIKGLGILEKYNDHELYPKIKVSLHMNILMRLTKTKIFEIDPIEFQEDSKELNELFDHHANIALALCKSYELKAYEQIVLIRKGLFYKDYKEVDENLEILRKSDNKNLYNMMKAGLNKYNYYNGTSISPKQIRIMMGVNLNKWRTSKGLTAEDIAMVIGGNTETSYVYAIERGDKGLSQYAIIMLCRTYNIDSTIFFEGMEEIEIQHDNRKTMIDKINAIISRLSDTSLEFLYQTAESHIKLEKVFKKNV